jgi:hypothetical protein
MKLRPFISSHASILVSILKIRNPIQAHGNRPTTRLASLPLPNPVLHRPIPSWLLLKLFILCFFWFLNVSHPHFSNRVTIWPLISNPPTQLVTVDRWRRWFSGKIHRCHRKHRRWAPGSIPGRRIIFFFPSCFLLGKVSFAPDVDLRSAFIAG